MKYKEFPPSDLLKPYIKCFYYFESDMEVEIKDTVFPGSNIEIIFNLGDGIWKIAPNGNYEKTPRIELWGQITRPLPVISEGKNKMLGVRFYAHGAALFFNEDISDFSNQVLDAGDVLGISIDQLHSSLLENSLTHKRLQLIEQFLCGRLFSIQKNHDRVLLIAQIAGELQKETSTQNVKTLASQYKLTPRYLQKLFLQYTGITPKVYHKINRFQLSLKLVAQKEIPLTNIAYDCGYFDQSHFIKEFKSFTGVTPSDYALESFPVAAALTAG